MFPKLDGDLKSVTNLFRFDHLTITDADDSSGVKTPLQNELRSFPIVRETFDDEDDETTISTDCLSPLDHDDFRRQLSPKSPGIISNAAKVLEYIINNSESGIPSIRRQKSLHESEPQLSLVTLRRNLEFPRFLSVDQRSISDTEDNINNESLINQKKNQTQSCANLRMAYTAPHSPGDVVVKEVYIDDPNCGKLNVAALRGEDASSTESIGRSSSATVLNKPRFKTVRIDESHLAPP